MNKPTEAQIKEFWEWCGLTKIKRGWKFPDGDALIDCGNPPIDLNNLFKYAVPKLKENGFMVSLNLLGSIIGDWSCRLHKGFFPNETFAEKENSDPALALFWAIWEVIHNDKPD